MQCVSIAYWNRLSARLQRDTVAGGSNNKSDSTRIQTGTGPVNGCCHTDRTDRKALRPFTVVWLLHYLRCISEFVA